uniref:ZF(C3H)-14 zinc finger (CCCH type) motif-containing protein HrZF-1 homolog n=1 Tax=Phallusia mammillata TaxID=59560 RepID=A0A6F9DY87_9ASCI|nr:ZF(C3H)-14 zinc finger (CCCH type) motif-containing protein HrZF-1 homolog [Phallusia mammillata]
MESKFNLTQSPFTSTACHTPVWPFRPRKFSSPFVTVPKFNIDETAESSSRDEHRGSSFDSGFGSVVTEHDAAEHSGLCPKYHNDGICEMGPICPLVHEKKTPVKISSSFNPSAPEFVPRSRQIIASQSWHGASEQDNSIARELTNLAISQSTELSDCYSPFKKSAITDETCDAPDLYKPFHVTQGQKSDDYDDGDWSRAPGAEVWRRPRPTKFKTEPCTTFHTIGSCPYGEKCNFYHKNDEKNVGKTKTRLCKSWNIGEKCDFGSKCDFAHGVAVFFCSAGSEELNVKYKTRMCKVFTTTGKCPYGDQCTFAHDKEEKRKDISTVYKFKTEICQLWLKGQCSFGVACHFAHGFEELNADHTF